MDVKEANRQHFNKEVAAKFDNPGSILIAQVISKNILEFSSEKLPVGAVEFGEDSHNKSLSDVSKFWDPASTRVMDFACGTGLISQNLAPYVKQIVGIDISEDMVNVFNQKVYNQGIDSQDMHAYVVDILEDEPKIPQGVNLKDFDAIVVSMSYHHISDIRSTTVKLAECLKTGGWLFVVDMCNYGHENSGNKIDAQGLSVEQSHSHGHSHGHSHVHGHVHSHGHGHSITDSQTENTSLDNQAINDSKTENASLDSSPVAHLGGLSPTMVKEAFEFAGLTNIVVEKPFKVRLWVDKEKLARFGAHVNKDAPSDEDCLDGLKIYDTKDFNGVEKYLIKLSLMLVTGQRV